MRDLSRNSTGIRRERLTAKCGCSPIALSSCTLTSCRVQPIVTTIAPESETRNNRNGGPFPYLYFLSNTLSRFFPNELSMGCRGHHVFPKESTTSERRCCPGSTLLFLIIFHPLIKAKLRLFVFATISFLTISQEPVSAECTRLEFHRQAASCS